ncbi:MAG: hypothetical protein COV66_01740 [Nitrospinae bacterium CG11_big_fil_rev_8_21_14_0_20_45_15]|nr:MAG: hypothetical protein COV66_01740 [Nitrospinae bacterium CG11_big_fil_rev_8_21_14_0_20_45_15]
MKRHFLGFVFILLGVLGTTNSARAYDPIEFTLVNETSTTLTAMYITLPEDRTWQRNIFDKQDTIRPGDTADISIDDRMPDCVYDVLMTFENGKIMEDLEVDLCNFDGEVVNVRDADLINPENSSDLYDVLRFLFES